MVHVLFIFHRGSGIVTMILSRLQRTSFRNFLFWTKSVGIKPSVLAPEMAFRACFWGLCARYFSPRFWYCHYQTRQTATNQFLELFISDSFLTKSVGISLRFWPRKRLFGADFGVPVLIIFRRDSGIVTTRLGRLL